MADTEDVRFHTDLLAIYRRSLKFHLRQHATLGVLVPFSLEESIQEAYIQIARSKALLRSWGQTVQDEPDDTPTQQAQHNKAPRLLNVPAILAARRARLFADGWREREAYRDTLIVPLPQGIPRINLIDLRSFIQRNTISLDGFGGPTFPRDQYSGNAQMRNVPDGCELVDTGSYVYQDWFFQAWSFSTDGTLFSRTSSFEDHETNKTYTGKVLRYMWMLQDIVRPLLFARGLLTQIEGIDSIELLLSWSGMDQRYLVDTRGFAIIDAGKCQQDEITVSHAVTSQTDLQVVARSLAEEVIWLCNWQRFNGETIDRDLATMLGGKFPQ